MSSVLGSLRRAREWAYPQRTTSAFLEKGVLTPEEFVRAGDELVYRCPTWQWEGGEDSQKRKSYLPPDKQYLITRNVPCQNRVSSMETNLKMEDGDEGDDDWLVSSILERKEDDEDDDDFDILDVDGEVMEKPKPAPVEESDAARTASAIKNDDNDYEYADMSVYEDSNVLVDDDAAAVVVGSVDINADNIMKVRTYDISITYDKVRQCGKSITYVLIVDTCDEAHLFS
jgi:ubiquitin-like-conjugating enzyme ATG3